MITAPLDMFVDAVLVPSGKVVRGQQLLKLDSRRLERELAHREALMLLLQIKAERLSDNYLEEFVFGPLNESLNYKQANKDILAAIERQTRDRFNVGEVTRTDVAFTISAYAKADADVSAAVDEILAHTTNIKKQKAIQDAAEKSAREQIDLLKSQIERTKIISPWNATVRALTADGLFVEKGDPLIELTQA